MVKPRRLPNGRWQARELVPGTKSYRSLGTFASEEEAQKAQDRAALMRELGIREAKATPKSEPPPRGQMKFWKYAETHIMVRKSDLSHGSWANFQRDYKNHIEPHFGHLKLADVTPARVKAWWTLYDERPGVRRSAYMVLSNIMRAAADDDEIAKTPCRVKGASKDVSKPRPVFSAGDVQVLRMLSSDPQVTCLLWVLVSSGLRIGEVLALDWDDIDLERGMLRVSKHMMPWGQAARGRKKHDDADVGQAVTRSAIAALQALKDSRADKSGAVFLNARRKPWRLSHSAWFARWDALRKACGLDHMHTHDIRAVHLTAFAEHATLKETMERGGHADYRSALRYQRPSAERQREIVANLESVL